MRMVLSVVLVALIGSRALVAAQSKPTVKEEKPGLLAQATITPDSATATALRAVAKNGKVVGAEIEMEDGLLVYSFDIKVAGRKGVEEVLVNAKTGAVVKVEHESAAAEAAEAKPARKPPAGR